MHPLFSELRTRSTRSVCRALYRRAIAGIETTAALPAGNLPYTLLSMVQHSDVLPYLVALKSFYAQAAAHRVVVVCDPSITQEDRALLQRHVPFLQLREAREFLAPELPQGGTWERLHAISTYAQDDYVVQLDADTLTLAPVPEVLHCIAQAHGFVLGEEAGQAVEAFAITSARARPWLEPSAAAAHIQAVVEADLVDAGLPDHERYVRGCSGFTGFPQDGDMRARLFDFSARMHRRHRQRWSEWGTEQISSNYLVANARGAKVLPFPRYGTPDMEADDAAFLHFIGYLRFVDRRYERLSRQAIVRLPKG